MTSPSVELPPIQDKSIFADFIRVFYEELHTSRTHFIAYVKAEAWHVREYECRRYKSYDCFKVMKSRKGIQERNLRRAKQNAVKKKDERDKFVVGIIAMLPADMQKHASDQWTTLK